MKKKFLRIGSLAIAAMIAFGTIAGCGAKKEEKLT